MADPEPRPGADRNISALGKFLAYGFAIAGAAGITGLFGLDPWMGVKIMCASLLVHWRSE